MNRKKRRQMSRYHIGQGVVKNAVDDAMDNYIPIVRRDAYQNAFASMLLALHQLCRFDYNMIRKIAVKTLQNINSTECATQLVEALKEATGFDVDETITDDELGMEVE